MSSFPRFLKQIPATRRAYSSFFSSKSGGGRYFNSAKPPKSVVAAGSSTNNGKVDPSTTAPSSADAKDGAQGATSSGSSGTGPNQLMKADVDNSHPHPQTSSAVTNAMSPTHDTLHQPNAPLALSSHMPSITHPALPPHPIVKPKDFKLHQFFSLHRPLLLLSHPPSILHSAPPTGHLLSPTPSHADATSNLPPPPPVSPFGILEDTPEGSLDADAEAARQLTRAFTINRAGATIAWENTLRRLGLDVDLDADRVGLQEQLDREWEEVMMDSTKRKRRKKMKKHKLKKRRKATRATRLKIGR